MLDGGIGQDRVAGFVLIRPQHDFALAVAEVVDACACDALELDGQDAGLFPLPFSPKATSPTTVLNAWERM
jgi:hypothetical protein